MLAPGQDPNRPAIRTTSLTVALLAFVCLSASIALGFPLQNRLPNHHLGADSKDTVKLASGMIATLTAMVLGLLVSPAKSSYDSLNAGVVEGGARMIQLDHALAHLGPETMPIRRQIRESVEFTLATVLTQNGASKKGIEEFEKRSWIDAIQQRIRALNRAPRPNARSTTRPISWPWIWPETARSSSSSTSRPFPPRSL